MRFDREFRHPPGVDRALTALREIVRETGPIRLMEICGTHTMAIAKSGLRSLLPEGLSLISGPGCPVCVTPAGAIDGILRLSEQHGVLLASYGDLLRVPGSERGIPFCAAARSARPFTRSILRWKRFRWHASIRIMR